MIKTNVEVREMAKKAADHGSLTQYATKNHDVEKKLVFTRFLGHKSDIKNSGQWKLLKPSENCWICDDWVYTLFFWSKKSGRRADDDL